jgi:hypothetical protein
MIPAYLMMTLFPKAQIDKTTSPTTTIPSMLTHSQDSLPVEQSRPLPELWGVGAMAWSSMMALCLPSSPGGSGAATAGPQILLQGQHGEEMVAGKMHFIEIFYCCEGMFLPQFVNIHLFYKCLILSE